MDKHIKPEGWHNWNKPNAEKTTYYAEYNSTGPGASEKRVLWEKKLNKESVKNYDKKKVLKGSDDWIPEL